MEIKVLGPGCKKCAATYEAVREAVAEAGLKADIEKVEGMLQIASYGVMGTPAVVVDNEVKLVGKVPTKQDILDMLA
jgi:small redox-active disulfide protein 2